MLDMTKYVLLDGVSSIDKGLALSDVSPLILPNRSRNREQRYANITAVESAYWKHQPATIKLPFIIEGTGKDDIINKYQALSGWFLKASELRIWYDLNKYYLGSIEGDVEFTVVSRRYGRLTVPFLCNPPCWHLVRSKQTGWSPVAGTPIPEQITAGTETVSRTNSGNLPSVTYAAAHPAALYLAITGTWTSLAIGGASGLVINWPTPQSLTLYIDCDTQEIYHKLGGVMTAVPYSGDFPTLESTGAIAVTGTNLAATIRMLVIERGNPMGHLTVYRHDMTPAAWVTEKLASGLGRLPDAVEPRTHLAINGDMSITMRYPINGKGYSLLQKGRLICAEGQLYRIYRIKKSDKDAGREVRVDALRLFYDLRKKEITNIETSETNPDGITQSAALVQILVGTPFNVGTVDNSETLDYLDVLQKSSFWALKEQVLGLWGGELEPDNWTINIRAQVGLDRRFPIRRGKNLKGIDYTESVEEIITRLHVSGYGGATFEDINNGLDYIDSPNIGAYRFLGEGSALEGRVEFADDDLPTVLMERALAHLPTVDVPQVSYDIDLLELRNSEQYKLYKPLETFGLGDTSVIHHEFFDVDIVARAIELDRNPVLEENVGVVLGNYKKDLYRALSDATKAADVVNSITTPNGGVRTARLQGVIDTLQNQLRASGSYANAAVLGNKGYLLENTNTESADYGAVYFGPGILALANTKLPNNEWDYKTWGGPNGLVGYLIMAHTVRAEQLDADEIFANVAFVQKLVTGLVASNLGQQLVLTSNTGIQLLVDDIDDLDERLGGAEASLLLVPGEITAEVNDAKNELYNHVSLTAQGLQGAFEDADAGLHTELVAEAGAIRTEITDAAAGLQTQINTVPGNITAAVSAMGVTQMLDDTGDWGEAWQKTMASGAYYAFGAYDTSQDTILISAVGAASGDSMVYQESAALPSTEYTLSFQFLQRDTSTYCRIFQVNASNTVIGYDDVPSDRNYISITTLVNCEKLRVYIVAEPGRSIFAQKAKLERGKKTDWSLSPKDTGTAISKAMALITPALILLLIEQGTSTKISLTALRALIESDSVLINTLAMSIVRRDENGNVFLNIGDNGLSTEYPISTPLVLSPSVLGVYLGPAAVTYAGGIQQTINNVAKYLKYAISIAAPAGDHYGNITLEDMLGKSITLNLNGTLDIYGKLAILNNQASVRVIGNQWRYAGVRSPDGDFSVYIDNNKDVEVRYLRCTGKVRTSASDGTAWGIYALNTSSLLIHDCISERTRDFAIGISRCMGILSNLKGGQTGGNYSSLANLGIGISIADGSSIGVYDTVPSGENMDKLAWFAQAPGLDTAVATDSPDAVPAPATTRTLTYTLAAAGTLKLTGSAWQWRSSDVIADAWQSDSDTYGKQIAMFALNNAANIAANIGSGTYVSVKIMLQRKSAYGDSGPVAFHLRPHNYATKAAIPSGTGTRPVLGSTIMDITFARDEQKTIDLPSSVFDGLKAGTIKGFGSLDSDPTCPMVGVCTLEVVVQGGP